MKSDKSVKIPRGAYKIVNNIRKENGIPIRKSIEQAVVAIHSSENKKVK